jgi:hypothetical protein
MSEMLMTGTDGRTPAARSDLDSHADILAIGVTVSQTCPPCIHAGPIGSSSQVAREHLFLKNAREHFWLLVGVLTVQCIQVSKPSQLRYV